MMKNKLLDDIFSALFVAALPIIIYQLLIFMICK